MTVHLVNPSHLSFGVGVITPRWLFVLAAATPSTHGRPRITDETLEPFDLDDLQPGDVVGIGIHTGNALRGYEIGTQARARGATVVFGGIHATLYPEEAHELGGAHAVVRGDGDVVWPLVLDHAVHGTLQRTYEGGRVDADRFVPARWELLPEGRYMWGSVQTVRGCPEALFVLLGLAHRRPEAAAARASMVSSPRSSSCGDTGFGSWRWPTTTSIRSRWRIWRWRSVSRTRHGSSSCRRCAPSDSS